MLGVSHRIILIEALKINLKKMNLKIKALKNNNVFTNRNLFVDGVYSTRYRNFMYSCTSHLAFWCDYL